ncbi:MAG: S-layer homology domain-containing protein [Thermofilum sp.]
MAVWDGNWLWIWTADSILNGNPEAMVAVAKDLGITGVLIKSHDGTRVWGQFVRYSLVFRSAGFRVAAWGYVYGNDPEGEAHAALEAIYAGADLYVVDAETEFERPGKDDAARRMLEAIRAKAPDVPVGFTSFAIVDYHRGFPWSVFAKYCDVAMPQMYWFTIGLPVEECWRWTRDGYAKMGKPIVPVGQAYDAVSYEDMVKFARIVHEDGCSGISWWSWQHANDAQLRAIKEASGMFQYSDYAGRPTEEDIELVKRLGIMVGYPDGTFRPRQAMAREEVASALARMWRLWDREMRKTMAMAFNEAADRLIGN